MTSYDEHFALLGRLVVRFAYLELTVKSVFSNVMNLTDHQLNSLIEFGRVKVTDMPAVVRSLLKDAPLPDFDRNVELVSALNDFEKLAIERNKLVHWIWGGGPTLMNFKGSTKPGKKKSFDEALTPEKLTSVVDGIDAANAVLCGYLRGADPLYPNRIDAPAQPLDCDDIPHTFRHHQYLNKANWEDGELVANLGV